MYGRTLLALWVVTAPAALTAQVGHEADGSPYADMRIKQTLTFVGGFLAGGRGSAQVGPTGGPLGGVRWDIWLGGGPTVGHFAFYRADLQRRLVRPEATPETRFIGEADQSVYMLEGGLDFVLTGRKTWHGLAPFISASMGAAFGTAVPQDSTLFTFETKFQIGPSIGVKIHPSRRIHLRLQVRDTLWRLSYPSTFFTAGSPPLLDPQIRKSAEWVHHAQFMIGLGYTLRL